MDGKRRFEDLAVGERVALGSIDVSADDIIAFARLYDPQPMHMDPVAAERSVLKGLAASGWHTSALATRLIADGFAADVAVLGSSGVDKCRWIKPLFPAERAGPMVATLEIEALAAPAEQPGVGQATLKVEILQRDPVAPTEAKPRLICLLRIGATIARRGPEPNLPPPPTQPAPPDAAAPIEAGFAFGCVAEVDLGRRTHLGEARLSAEEIADFAARYDPGRLHRVPGAPASDETLGASGLHVMCRCMRLIIEGRTTAVLALPEDKRAAAAAGLGPSPGYRDLRWSAPVKAGDAIQYFQTPTHIRRKEHWTDWVVLHTLLEAANQRGDIVAVGRSEVMLRP